jgi:tetratricopeptide (TPR) repeat protein
VSWAVVAVVLASVSGCKKPGDDVDPKLKADGVYVGAQTAFLKGDFAEAHKEFDEVRKLNPNDPRLPAAEAEVYLAEANVEKALELYEEASKKDPKRATTWSRMAYLYALKNEREKAQAAVEKALAANPTDFNALETQGDLWLKEGKVDEAVKSYVKASETAPEKAKPELVLKGTAELTKKNRAAEGWPLLEAAVAKGISSAELWTELGDRRVEGGKLAEAAQAYGEAAKANAKDPSLWELVGEVELKRERYDDAKAAFEKALAVKDRGVVHAALARVCQAKKDEACVKAELDKALATASGEELRESLDLADLLGSVGRKKDALALLKGLSEEPDQKSNTELHLRTARLAKELGEKPVVQAACLRAAASAKVKCP